MVPMIEKHYKDNYLKLMKRMTFKAGTPEAAEDIIQETYYRALKYKDTCKPETFDKWINMILYNTLRDYKREELGRIEDEFEEQEVEGHPCSEYSDHVMREIVNLINTKSDSHKEILTLHIVQNYSARDISQITEFSHEMSRKVITRFRNELKEIYK